MPGVRTIAIHARRFSLTVLAALCNDAPSTAAGKKGSSGAIGYTTAPANSGRKFSRLFLLLHPDLSQNRKQSAEINRPATLLLMKKLWVSPKINAVVDTKEAKAEDMPSLHPFAQGWGS
jgi:hypothetical protein